MTIDERGNVVWTRESDDHRLYYVNNNGVWSDDYVSVSDRSILDDLTKTEAKVDGGAKVSSHTSKTPQRPESMTYSRCSNSHRTKQKSSGLFTATVTPTPSEQSMIHPTRLRGRIIWMSNQMPRFILIRV